MCNLLASLLHGVLKKVAVIDVFRDFDILYFYVEERRD